MTAFESSPARWRSRMRCVSRRCGIFASRHHFERCARLEVAPASCSVERFPDGELHAGVSTIRGRDVFILAAYRAFSVREACFLRKQRNATRKPPDKKCRARWRGADRFITSKGGSGKHRLLFTVLVAMVFAGACNPPHVPPPRIPPMADPTKKAESMEPNGQCSPPPLPKVIVHGDAVTKASDRQSDRGLRFAGSHGDSGRTIGCR
jgi:hypothetical protein